MTKPFMFSCLLLLNCLACLAQQSSLDSLYHLYQLHKENDTAKVSLLLQIAVTAFNDDREKGFLVMDSAITLAQQTGNAKKLAEAYDKKVVLFYLSDSASAAYPLAHQAISLFKQAHYDEGTAIAYFHLGLLQNSQSKYIASIKNESVALEFFQKLQNKMRCAVVLNSLGANYKSLGSNEEAIHHYLRSVKIFEELKDENSSAMLYDNIAMVYESINDTAKALSYFNQSLALYTKLDNQKGTAKVLNGLGTLYDNMHQTDKAATAYQKALAVNKGLNNKAEMGANCINIGILYFDKAQYDSAWQYIQTSYQLFTETGNKSNLAVAARYLGDIVNKAPDEFLIKQHIRPLQRQKESFDYYHHALQYAVASEALEEEMDTWQSISDAYAQNKQFALALDAFKRFNSLQDNLLNDDKKNAITHAGMQYEFDKREAIAKAEHDKKQALAEAALNRQRIINIAVAVSTIVLLLAACFSFLFYKRRRDALERGKEAELKADIAETEMKALRAQMNPHFIFNSLNSISDYIVKNDTKMADEYLSKFASVMRMILENSEQKEISLADDLKALELYMQLEALRLHNKFNYEINVEETIDIHNTLIPPLLLQPFVENSIWHGIAKKEGKGRIAVYIRQQNGMLVCIVDDNGVGLSSANIAKTEWQAKERTSMGMKITNARIDVINRTKKASASVKQLPKEEGVRTELQLPLELMF